MKPRLIYLKGYWVDTDRSHLTYNLALIDAPMDFSTINYLKSGNAKQRLAYEVLYRYQIMETLQAFDPLLAGTIPIGIDTDQSDLDIICYYQDKADFITTIKKTVFGIRWFSVLGKSGVSGRGSQLSTG